MNDSNRIMVRWSNGLRGFLNLGEALDFAKYIQAVYNETPFIDDEF